MKCLFVSILALLNLYRRKIVASHERSNIDITGEKLQCLRSGAWLNDEVIFCLYLQYLKLIVYVTGRL